MHASAVKTPRQNAARIVLTGIKPTGTPHLGNYAGAIAPSIAQSRQAGVQSYYFLADYHALIGGTDPLKVQRSTLEIAASWLALGLDPAHVHFYRQSDVPEITELNWLLSVVAAKGLLNRAHAYKAAVDHNTQHQHDPDFGVSAGLYGYPVLMAADILMFNAELVPVGKDQVQHIEIARDIASRFNHLYQGDYFTLPEALVDEQTAVLPGLDGRKMSKSYDNVIGLFLPSKALREKIMQVQTNSKAPGERKSSEESALHAIYQAFASHEETLALSADLQDGIGWGEVKQRVFDKIDHSLSAARERFDALMLQPDQVEQILRAGAEKVRPQAQHMMATLRHAVGLRALNTAMLGSGGATKVSKPAQPRLLTFKDSEGFRFKLHAADGKTVLFESIAFADAKLCGQTMGQVKSGAALVRETEFGHELVLSQQIIGNGSASAIEVQVALAQLQDSLP